MALTAKNYAKFSIRNVSTGFLHQTKHQQMDPRIAYYTNLSVLAHVKLLMVHNILFVVNVSSVIGYEK